MSLLLCFFFFGIFFLCFLVFSFCFVVPFLVFRLFLSTPNIVGVRPTSALESPVWFLFSPQKRLVDPPAVFFHTF